MGHLEAKGKVVGVMGLPVRSLWGRPRPESVGTYVA